MNKNKVHFAQSLRYQPFGRDTDFDFHEIIVGPLNAGPFNRPDLDETFSPERLFYYAPEGLATCAVCRICRCVSAFTAGPVYCLRAVHCFAQDNAITNCHLFYWFMIHVGDLV